MATIRNRGTKQNPLVQVQVRRKNYPFQNKVLTRKQPQERGRVK